MVGEHTSRDGLADKKPNFLVNHTHIQDTIDSDMATSDMPIAFHAFLEYYYRFRLSLQMISATVI